MKLTDRMCRRLAAYVAAIGLTYIIVGVLELANAAYTLFIAPEAKQPLIGVTGIPADDIFGGLSALVIGAVFLRAIGLWRLERESMAYILGGTLLSAVFGVVYLLIFAADGLSALIALAAGEEAEWLWLSELLRPEIWLFIASLPMALVSWRSMLSRSREGD